MSEYAQANVEVAWSQRGATGTVYEKQAIFLIDGHEDMSDEEFIQRAHEQAAEQIEHYLFIEILESELQDRYLIDHPITYNYVTRIIA